MILTVVSAGAAAVTVTFVEPDTLVPPADACAEIVELPAAIAVTRPDADTVAIARADDDQVTVAAIAAPFWSFGAAVSCAVCPMVRLVVPDTVTDVSTGVAVTVMENVPVAVAEPATAVAVMVAVPAPTAATSPEEVTVATFAAELAHVTVAATAAPVWSRGVALNCRVCPGTSALAVPDTGLTLTVVTTGCGAAGDPVEVLFPPPPPPERATAARPQTIAARKHQRPPAGTNFVFRTVRPRPASASSSALPRIPMRRPVRSATTAAIVMLSAVSTNAVAQKPLGLTKAEAEFADPFTQISGVRELKDGRVLVADARDKTLQLIDLKSGSATKVGREGQGPGEYSLPFRLMPLPGDSSALYDAGNQRYLTVHPDGQTGNDFRLEADRPTATSEGAGGGRGGRGGRGGMMSIAIPRGVDAKGNVYYQGRRSR